jgi:hypothetical protein
MSGADEGFGQMGANESSSTSDKGVHAAFCSAVAVRVSRARNAPSLTNRSEEKD